MTGHSLASTEVARHRGLCNFMGASFGLASRGHGSKWFRLTNAGLMDDWRSCIVISTKTCRCPKGARPLYFYKPTDPATHKVPSRTYRPLTSAIRNFIFLSGAAVGNGLMPSL